LTRLARSADGDGGAREVVLEPKPVAAFYGEILEFLRATYAAAADLAG
jgi:hypothetical protein